MKPTVAFIAGMVGGTTLWFGSLLITVYSVNKLNTENKSIYDDKLKTILEKIKKIAPGTTLEPFVDKYVSIINDTYKIFENDYAVMVDSLDSIVKSYSNTEEWINKFETYIVSLDVILTETKHNLSK